MTNNNTVIAFIAGLILGGLVGYMVCDHNHKKECDVFRLQIQGK